ncbi:MAG: protein-disulfide reductase DsbD family protein [Planctomycetota bacterium]|nr:protein-disulfide reductase DsbD family protein [Planctomycetota bacterium]
MSALLLWSALLLPQFGSDQGSAEITAAFAVDAVASGETAELHVNIDVTPGWHVYHPDQDPANGIPITVDVSTTGLVSTGRLISMQEPEVHELTAGTFHATYLWLSGNSELVLPVTLSGDLGTREIKVTVNYQICDENVCLQPMSQDFSLSMDVTAAVLTEQGVKESGDGSTVDEIQENEVPEFELDREDVVFDKVKIDFELDGNVAEGETVNVIVKLEVVPGWHVYDPKQDPLLGIPVTAIVYGEGLVMVEPLTTDVAPESHITRFGGGVQQYWWQSGKLEFRGKLRFEGPIPSDAKLRLLWQTCNEDSCLMPEQKTYSLAEYATVVGTGRDADAAGVISGLPAGFWKFMLAAITAGLLTLLTPCVFPMIPVTISYFTKRAETGKGTPMGNAVAYACGIIFTFAGIGVGAALALGATGANAIGSNPWVNAAIGILFVVMALSLLGFFEIQAPRFLQNFASKTQSQGQAKAGYLPVFMMAIAFSITAFTCTVGFVGLVFAAGLQLGVGYLVGGMFVYGLVFALPFFFLALLPARLQKMPSAGGWMNTVKVCAGFVELLAAIKFFSNTDLVWELEILTWPIVLAASTIIMLLWGAYMLGLYKLPYDYEKPKPGGRRKVFGALIVLTGLWLSPAIFNREYNLGGLVAYLPPPTYGFYEFNEETGLIVGPASLEWYENYDLAFKVANDTGMPLFIDFTGVTCVNCRLMEFGVFPDDEVRPKLELFTRVELWVDKEPQYGKMQAERYGRVSQPYYVLLDPRTDTVLATYDGFDPDPSKFAEFLQKGLDAYAAK